MADIVSCTRPQQKYVPVQARRHISPLPGPPGQPPVSLTGAFSIPHQELDSGAASAVKPAGPQEVTGNAQTVAPAVRQFGVLPSPTSSDLAAAHQPPTSERPAFLVSEMPAAAVAEPALVSLDDLLPVALRRIGSLEHVVAGQQAQLNELVPLQRDILAMHSALCSQQALVVQEQSALREAHEALCAQHLALCDCLGLAAPLEEMLGPPVGAASRYGLGASGGDELPPGGAAPHEPELLVASATVARGDGAAASPMAPQLVEVGGRWGEPEAATGGPKQTRGPPAERTAPPLDEVYAVGGQFCGLDGTVGEVSAAVERFSSGSGCWESVAPMASARMQHRVAALGGTLYVVGGRNSDQCLASSERFRPGAGQWEAMPPMNLARYSHDLAVLGGMLYVTGGTCDGRSRFASCERFDPAASSWDCMPPMTMARHGHTSVVLRDSLYVVSGEEVRQSRPVACESFDPSTSCWAPLPPMSAAWDTLRATAVAEKLYIVASSLSRRGAAACERYDPDIGTWEALPRNELLHICSAAAEVAGRLYVFGKLSHQSNFAVCQCYDPNAGQWEQLPPMPTERTSCQVLSVGGKIYVAGRCSDAEVSRARTLCVAERFDPASRRWEALRAPPRLDCQLVALVL